MAEMIVLGAFCVIGIPFMLYVLIGTQRELNREKRANIQGRASASGLRWK